MDNELWRRSEKHRTPVLVQRARQLRNNPTEVERKLWRYLSRRQIEGVKFRRQHPVGPYIVDFASLRPPIVIELDGGQHFEEADYDRTRDEFLRKAGFKVLRFWNAEINEDLERVLEDIQAACLE